jgi:hypothetical protein
VLTRFQRQIRQENKGLEPLKEDKYSKAERYQKLRRENDRDGVGSQGRISTVIGSEGSA